MPETLPALSFVGLPSLIARRNSNQNTVKFGTLCRAIATSLILSISANAAVAPTPASNAVAMKAKVEKRGIGNSARIIKTDGSAMVGKIESVGADSFQLLPRKSTTPSEIAFADVSAVHGTGLSTGAKIAIGVVVGVGLAVGIAAIIYKSSPGISFKNAKL
jgi:hypothetical protein